MQNRKKNIFHSLQISNSVIDEIFLSSSSDIIFPSSNFEELSTEQKIFDEKRKRNQAYRLLDYQLSLVSYFDFFSHDAFLVAKYSKYIAYFYEKENVDNTILFLSLLSYDSNLKILLDEFKINSKTVSEMIIERKEKIEQRKIERELTEYSIADFSFQNLISPKNRAHFWKYLNFHFPPFKTVKTFLKKESFQIKEWIEELENFFGVKKELDLHERISFSRDAYLLFEKAAENALLRFKTPVITSEILFLTFLESKNSTIGKILEEILTSSTEWYLIRYRILKQLHASESILRNEVIKNQHFFAYLLKTQLTEKEYQKLIEKQLLSEGVSYFRNNLIQLTMKNSLSEILSEEIHQSIRLTSHRRYSK